MPARTCAQIAVVRRLSPRKCPVFIQPVRVVAGGRNERCSSITLSPLPEGKGNAVAGSDKRYENAPSQLQVTLPVKPCFWNALVALPRGHVPDDTLSDPGRTNRKQTRHMNPMTLRSLFLDSAGAASGRSRSRGFVSIPSRFTRLYVVAAVTVTVGMVAPSFWSLTIFVPPNFRGSSPTLKSNQRPVGLRGQRLDTVDSHRDGQQMSVLVDFAGARLRPPFTHRCRALWRMNGGHRP